MIKIPRYSNKTVSVYFSIEENPTSGTFGDYQLLKREYRKIDTEWIQGIPADVYRQVTFNLHFLRRIERIYGSLHCVYCGQQNLVIFELGEVPVRATMATTDHYLPKSLYPELAYVESNLRVCCNKCNNKKAQQIWEEKFPYMSQEKYGVDWCIERHQVTNHYYDKYLPYEFHLRMTAQVCQEFKQLALNKVCNNNSVTFAELLMGCWAHDLIEDTRTSFNDVRDALGTDIANLVYALTNEKGKNRGERGNSKYYEGIRNVPGGVFLKLCDRIANVQYSKMTRSPMFGMYKEENKGFLEKIGHTEDHALKPMFDYLINLFE